MLALLCALGAGLAHAQGQTAPEALALLRKIHFATQNLSYTGTFVYQQGGRTETSRITRIADAFGGIEKLEVLDGVPREIVRTRDTVRCYLPDSQLVKIDRRDDARAFPALLPDEFAELARHYLITRGERARVAGLDCESVLLTPRDELRYGHKLCADATSGMLLKARIVDGKGDLVEQFIFTQIAIGSVARDKVKSRHASRSWRIEETAVAPANLAEAGWSISSDLPGFRKIVEVQRRLRESGVVGQVVYSDGMAAVSVFVESLAGHAEPVRPGLSKLGAINIVTREVSNHLVTVVGEAPAASVQRIAERVEFKRPQ
jgi:sigma-E factor negative regulatory protein RseB